MKRRIISHGLLFSPMVGNVHSFFSVPGPFIIVASQKKLLRFETFLFLSFSFASQPLFWKHSKDET